MSESKQREADVNGRLTEDGYNRIIAGVLASMPKDSGFVGMLNIYTCELPGYNGKQRSIIEPPGCGSIVLTRDVDHGVTPGFIRCETCGGTKLMISSFYRVQNQAAREGSQWYRPTFAQYQDLPPASREHVLRGGLLLRPYQEVKADGADSQT